MISYICREKGECKMMVILKSWCAMFIRTTCPASKILLGEAFFGVGNCESSSSSLSILTPAKCGSLISPMWCSEVTRGKTHPERGCTLDGTWRASRLLPHRYSIQHLFISFKLLPASDRKAWWEPSLSHAPPPSHIRPRSHMPSGAEREGVGREDEAGVRWMVVAMVTSAQPTFVDVFERNVSSHGFLFCSTFDLAQPPLALPCHHENRTFFQMAWKHHSSTMISITLTTFRYASQAFPW